MFSFILGLAGAAVLFELSVCFKCITNLSINANEPLVETRNGMIVGKIIKVLGTDIASFQGIPFAEPPIGDKRFTKPIAINNWNGTLFAKEKPPSCMQYSNRSFPWIPKGLSKSEDCLYLNIWTPTTYTCRNTSEKLPVIVWIYGGGFSSGSSSMDLYDGSVLAAIGEVIVVTLNYRVGLFGFLNGGTSEAPGNVGLFDQLLALKWINANIQKFGGDSKLITLSGESTGAVSVALHITSPLSQGLFQKAIMESATSYTPLVTEEIQSSLFKANELAEVVGCSNKEENLTSNPFKVIQCLKNKPALELAEAENIFTSKFPAHFSATFGADDFLPNSPIKVFESGKGIQIPVLLGNNENEGGIFLNYMMPDIFPVDHRPVFTLTQAKSAIKHMFSLAPDLSSQAIFDFYFDNITEHNSADILDAISNAFGDLSFNCASLYFAEKTEEAYVYWMTHRSYKDINTEWLSMTHFSEVPYVFGIPVREFAHYTPEDKIFSVDVIRKWINFAKYGYPLIGEINQSWTKFNPSNPMAYELNPKRKGMMIFPRKEACEFWRPYILKK